MSVTENENLNGFHLLECGNGNGSGFQVWAEATEEPDARTYICSTDTREHGEQIVAAMVAANFQREHT